MCKLYVVLISELNTAPPFSPPPLLLITTSVLQSNLIRIQFSSLCLSLSPFGSPPSPPEETVGRLGCCWFWFKPCRFIWMQEKADIRTLHHGFISHTAGHACKIWLRNEGEGKKNLLCKCHIFFVSATLAFFFLSFLQGNATHTHTQR